MFFLARINRAVRPNSPYNVPFLPFNFRTGYEFPSKYATDFYRATVESDLSNDFSPEEALKQIKHPMLLLRADAYRHET